VLLVYNAANQTLDHSKGWPIKGLKPPKSAAREAYEKLVSGAPSEQKQLGFSLTKKGLDATASPCTCEVRVFPMIVKRAA